MENMTCSFLNPFLSLFIFWSSIQSVHHPSPSPTQRVNRFALTQVSLSHFHYKTEWIQAAARITSPHLAWVHFPESSSGFHSLCSWLASWMRTALVHSLFFSYLRMHTPDWLKSFLSGQQNHLVSDQVFSRNLINVREHNLDCRSVKASRRHHHWSHHHKINSVLS